MILVVLIDPQCVNAKHTAVCWAQRGFKSEAGACTRDSTSAPTQWAHITFPSAAQCHSGMGDSTAGWLWVTACLSRSASGKHGAYPGSYQWLEKHKPSLRATWKCCSPWETWTLEEEGNTQWDVPEGWKVMLYTSKSCPLLPSFHLSLSEAGADGGFPILALQGWWNCRGISNPFLKITPNHRKKKANINVTNNLKWVKFHCSFKPLRYVHMCSVVVLFCFVF